VSNQTLLVIFVALTGVAVMLQTAILLALYLTMRRAVNSVREQVEDLRSSALPVLSETKEFLDRVGPKVDSVVSDLAELTRGLRVQSTELQITATEIIERVRRQTSRMDYILTGVLDTVDRAGTVVSEVISVPLRQIAAVAASIKAVIGVLVSREIPRPRQTHSPADKDMFV